MITNREADDTRIVQYSSDTTYYDVGGASFLKFDWMADAIAGMRERRLSKAATITPLATCRALHSRAVQCSSSVVHMTSVVLRFEFGLNG